ncbi:hypothetical protein INE92_03109 [Bacteroides xylanisolvens]|nr:hypothetical protein INE92_03109 [Bacteroides xylanisolvens]
METLVLGFWELELSNDEIIRSLKIGCCLLASCSYIAIPKKVFYILIKDIPKIIKFKATNSLRVSCLFCIFKHPPQKRFDGQNGGN